jgi:hypothetical protein
VKPKEFLLLNNITLSEYQISNIEYPTPKC